MNNTCTHLYFVSSPQLYAGDDKTVIGKVSKNWSGAAREIFTDADNYSCECKSHVGLDPTMDRMIACMRAL